MSVLGASIGLAQPTLSFQTSNVCFNNSGLNTFTVTVSNNTGPSTYSWSSQGPNCSDSLVNVSGLSAEFVMNCCGMHTINCQVYSGSTLCCVATGTITKVCPPVVTVSASKSVVCVPSSWQSTLVASGAQSYTWINGPTGSQNVVTPTATTCYTVVGQGFGPGCTSQAAICVGVAQDPNITISSTGSVLCQGNQAVLTASGGLSYTWTPSLVTSPNLIVSPMSNTCYTVTGFDGNCLGSASSCFSVLNAPTLLPSSFYTVCLGSSITLTASTAASYTWNTNPPVLTNTLNVLTAVPVTYTVQGTGSNGCQASMAVQVWPDTTCANVWPGDANSDGSVSSADVVELGLYASSTGAARSSGGNSWTAQYATAWTGSGSNGQNRCHVDCNGDGVVNASDTLAISLNWALSHSFRESQVLGADDITLSAPTWISSGTSQWHKVDISLGSSTNVMQDVYGVSFDLQFDADFVDNNQVYVTYPAAFLGTVAERIPFRRVDPAGGLVNCVSVRNTGTDVTGFGKFAEFYFKSKAQKIGTMSVSATNVKVYGLDGAGVLLSPATATILAGVEAVGEHNGVMLRMYPNPANDVVNVVSSSSSPSAYEIMDLSGRVLLAAHFEESVQVDISELASGTYMVKIVSAEGTRTQRLLVE